MYFKVVNSRCTKLRFGILGIKGYILGKSILLLSNKSNTPNGEVISLKHENSKKRLGLIGRHYSMWRAQYTVLNCPRQM